jgi:tRNA 2-(methylsulfanyl)-N6-isopentenyladenosine37 hydroxylase
MNLPQNQNFAQDPSVAIGPSIRFLQHPTRPEWLQQALSNLDEVLLDHAHCERKAAGVALNLMFRYPSHEGLNRVLSAIAREELEHFQQVHRLLEARGAALRPLAAPPYGAGLRAEIRKTEPDRLLDSLLVAALIEARSHERLGLLAAHCPEATLAAFYRGLMASEARHYGAYWLLASQDFPRPLLETRLGELAVVELVDAEKWVKASQGAEGAKGTGLE